MTQARRTSGVVHWVGAGRSTGSGLSDVCTAGVTVRLWHRTHERASLSLEALGLRGRAEARAFNQVAFEEEVAPGDIVVSMLPVAEHSALLRAAVHRGAHFACSSYVSDDIRALIPAASECGLVVLAEAGLDPGIDHVLAHDLIDRAVTAMGSEPAEVDFTSYCGGVPAKPNEFRYQFSWAPRGVLGALRSPARYIMDGRTTTCDRPWEATTTVMVDGEEFEGYPNRDSIPFVTQYHLPQTWSTSTFVRGTLRLRGWYAAWEPVFDTLRAGNETRIDELADKLAQRYPTTPTDRDRVVLAVAVRARRQSGSTWSGRYLLDEVGDESESAMARCVSRALAVGIAEILDGKVPAGLTRGVASATDARRWLARLAERNLEPSLTISDEMARIDISY